PGKPIPSRLPKFNSAESCFRVALAARPPVAFGAKIPLAGKPPVPPNANGALGAHRGRVRRVTRMVARANSIRTQLQIVRLVPLNSASALSRRPASVVSWLVLSRLPVQASGRASVVIRWWEPVRQLGRL